MSGGDFNCPISESDKKGGKNVDTKIYSVIELQEFIKMHDLVDSWHFKNPDQDLFGFTWSNPCMKIRCRLDYLFVQKKIN